MGFIYKITNTINDKVYIGKTTRTIEERWKEHLNSIKDKDFKIYRAFRKYGVKNFSIESIEECSNDIINEREIYWIDFYNSYEEGYNSTRGGEGSRFLTQKEISTIVNLYQNGYCIRDIQKLTNSAIETISFYIKQELKLSEEDIKKRGYAIRTAKQKHIVEQYDLQGNFIASYTSYKDAQLVTGIWYNHISEVCRGKRLTAGGYTWKNGGK